MSASAELRLAREFVQACRARKPVKPSAIELLESVNAAIRALPVEKRGDALDALRFHLAEALLEIDDAHRKPRRR